MWWVLGIAAAVVCAATCAICICDATNISNSANCRASNWGAAVWNLLLFILCVATAFLIS